MCIYRLLYIASTEHGTHQDVSVSSSLFLIFSQLQPRHPEALFLAVCSPWLKWAALMRRLHSASKWGWVVVSSAVNWVSQGLLIPSESWGWKFYSPVKHWLFTGQCWHISWSVLVHCDISKENQLHQFHSCFKSIIFFFMLDFVCWVPVSWEDGGHLGEWPPEFLSAVPALVESCTHQSNLIKNRLVLNKYYFWFLIKPFFV